MIICQHCKQQKESYPAFCIDSFTNHEWIVQAEAIRNPIQFRFDILDPEFLQTLAKIADYGAKKYGEFNWHKSRLEGDKSPVNHIARHLLLYEQAVPYDHEEVINSKDPKMHLAAIAFNAMMEFWYENHPEIK